MHRVARAAGGWDRGGVTLDGLRARAFALLSEGVGDPRSPHHWPALATAGAGGHPSVRTVVLRGFDPDGRVLTVHTDRRAAKVAEVARDNRVSLHVYDGPRGLQLRLSGTARCHAGDATARAEWAGLHAGSRATYRVEPAPGTVLADPAGADPAALDEAAAFAAFAVLRVEMTALEYLDLDVGRTGPGQRRARFTWPDNGATWLVP